jgi:hypothetical protein
MTGTSGLLMRRGLSAPVRAAIFAALALCSFAQSSAERGGSPKEVVEMFLKADANGERLTIEGQRRAATFFARPSSVSRSQTLTVGTCETPGQPVVTGNRAEVWTEGDLWGKIDPTARFSPSSPGPDGRSAGPIFLRCQFILVFSDTYWELAPDGLSLKQTKGKAAWRIQSADLGPYLSLATAVRYLTGLRDKSGDTAIRKNAEKSLAELRGL